MAWAEMWGPALGAVPPHGRHWADGHFVAHLWYHYAHKENNSMLIKVFQPRLPPPLPYSQSMATRTFCSLCLPMWFRPELTVGAQTICRAPQQQRTTPASRLPRDSPLAPEPDPWGEICVKLTWLSPGHPRPGRPRLWGPTHVPTAHFLLSSFRPDEVTVTSLTA